MSLDQVDWFRFGREVIPGALLLFHRVMAVFVVVVDLV